MGVWKVIVLGIDPGLRFTGYGLIQKNGHQALLLDCGYLSLSPTKTVIERVGIFHSFFFKMLNDRPEISDIALETPFLGKNAQNFLKLGYLRGNLYQLAYHYKKNVLEFSPREVKQALTGFGGASKDQVARMILQLFPRLQKPKKDDVTDALAVTLCGIWKNKQLSY